MKVSLALMKIIIMNTCIPILIIVTDVLLYESEMKE